jgi:hypothetical protein
MGAGAHLQRYRASPGVSAEHKPISRPPTVIEESGLTDHTNRLRAKGHCLAVFGFGGKLVTMQPIKQSRFNAAQNATVEKTYPGNVIVMSLKTHKLPALEQENAKVLRWQGPILGPKARPNKKEAAKIFSATMQSLAPLSQGVDGEEDKRRVAANEQERLALWKLVGAAIDNDGLLFGQTNKPSASLGPGLEQILKELNGANPQMGGFFGALEAALLEGDKAKACAIAQEQGQWGHALVLASFIDRATYSDVLSAFAQTQFEGGEGGLGSTLESSAYIPTLHILYKLFAGKPGEEAVIDFLPPEMTHIPTAEEVNVWRRILGMVLANRTAGDSAAITALGDLLFRHSRLFASHIW